MRVGRMHELYRFEKRIDQADDGYGNIQSEWLEQFKQRGERLIRKSGEKVMAKRLEGVQTIIIRLRKSERVDQICSGWRAVDCRTGETFNVRGSEPDNDRMYYGILCESGVADG